MSQSRRNKIILEEYKNNSNNSKLFDEDLILYNDEVKAQNFYEAMKRGYIEMSKINLEIAIDNESELVDVNNYEEWLCGV